MRVLVLTTDAYGGHGGIAQYNRDLLSALCAMPEVTEVVAVPRNIHYAPGNLPHKLRYYPEAAGSKLRFIHVALRASRGHYDLVICGHINLLPVASLVNLKVRAPLVLLVYGIDVWQPPQSGLTRRLANKLSAVWSISEITRDRMVAWSGLSADYFQILPNAIDLSRYGPGPRNPALVSRYGLENRKVIMMLGRLSASERYKGVDEVLEAMPQLIKNEPMLTFLVAGDGDDRARLEDKARNLGLSGHVVFAGFVPESEKIDHFRLADAYVMPGRGEGFGFVFLEAMACGIPVVASRLDGSREAVRGGKLGRIVDPDDQGDIASAIKESLSKKSEVPEGLDYFAFPGFQSRLHAALLAVKRD